MQKHMKSGNYILFIFSLIIAMATIIMFFGACNYMIPNENNTVTELEEYLNSEYGISFVYQGKDEDYIADVYVYLGHSQHIVQGGKRTVYYFSPENNENIIIKTACDNITAFEVAEFVTEKWYYDDLKEVVLDEVLYELDTPKLDMDKTPKNELIDNISAVYNTAISKYDLLGIDTSSGYIKFPIPVIIDGKVYKIQFDSANKTDISENLNDYRNYIVTY